MSILSADTALDRDTQYLVDKGMIQVNTEQFTDVVTRFFNDGLNEEDASKQALITIRNLNNGGNNNERIG